MSVFVPVKPLVAGTASVPVLAATGILPSSGFLDPIRTLPDVFRQPGRISSLRTDYKTGIYIQPGRLAKIDSGKMYLLTGPAIDGVDSCGWISGARVRKIWDEIYVEKNGKIPPCSPR